jgi:fermentation-respiration switch protein FrsA (DUF1100 family)
MLLNLALVIGGFYSLFALSMYFFQSRLVYFPEPLVAATPASVGLEFEEVAFTTRDGVELHGWYVAGDDAAPTVLFFHGNAGNISHRLESLLLFHRLRYNTFIFDYRGYGRSAGTPSEEGTYRDAEAAWRYVAQHLAPAERTVLFGRSLGAAVATWLATQEKPAALIVESGFTSVPDLGAEIYPFLPVGLLARIRYDTRARIGQVRCPVLVIHSGEDEIVPYAHGEALFQQANQPKQLLTIRGSHNDGFMLSGETYLAGIASFVTTAIVAQDSTPARSDGDQRGSGYNR